MEKLDDRISELPDSILHHILSLMPLQSSARTSILSRTWSDLWKCYSSCIKTLDFGVGFARGDTPEELVATVNQHLMQLHKGDYIRKFRLFFNYPHLYSSDIEKWIEFAVARGLIELDLDFYPRFLFFNRLDPPFKLPYCVFSCDSLIHLNLANCHFNYPSDFEGFHALKTLTLRTVHITDEMLQSLVSHCPLLEELDLRKCFSLSCINVSASMLKILTVLLSSHEWIQLSTPNLQSFHYRGNLFYYHSFKNISSLVDVILHCDGSEDTELEHNYISILKDLVHIKILTLSSGPLSYINSVEGEGCSIEDLPITFYNLEELQLHNLPLCDEYLYNFYVFFRYCNFPCLERLFISVPRRFYDYEFQYSPEEPTMCTFYHLKVIQISGFKGHKNEMRLVKFLLEKAIVLETLILIVPQNAYSEKDVNIANKHSTSRFKDCQIPPLPFLQEQLASFPKASQEGQIVLCEYSDENNKLRPTHTNVYCGNCF